MAIIEWYGLSCKQWIKMKKKKDYVKTGPDTRPTDAAINGQGQYRY